MDSQSFDSLVVGGNLNVDISLTSLHSWQLRDFMGLSCVD